MVLVVCPSCGRHAFDHEEACPHCGQRGRPTLRALVAALGFVTVACSEAVMGVYGPAPVDPTARMPSADASATSASPAPSATAAPSAVDVASGAAPAASANPSASASPAPTGSGLGLQGSGTSKTVGSGVTQPRVYGPPPRDPKQRN